MVGSVGNLHQQSNVFTVLGRRLKLRERQSKPCLYGHILPYVMMCHSTLYLDRINKEELESWFRFGSLSCRHLETR